MLAQIVNGRQLSTDTYIAGIFQVSRGAAWEACLLAGSSSAACPPYYYSN